MEYSPPISMQYREGEPFTFRGESLGEGENQGGWHTACYLYDGEGNVRQLTNSRGQIIANYNYLPFGEMMNRGERGINLGIGENNGIGMIWGRENGLRNTITYQGREYDRDAGLYYYRARYQDPRLGRFLEVDPLLREVPEYATGNSLPTGTSLGGCSSCDSGVSPSISSQVFNPAELQIYMAQIQQILPLLLNNTNSVSIPYMFEKNNPINNIDPTGFKGFWVRVNYFTGPPVPIIPGLLRTNTTWYAYYWKLCATSGIPDDSSVDLGIFKIQYHFIKWITLFSEPWGVGDLYLDSYEFTSYVPSNVIK